MKAPEKILVGLDLQKTDSNLISQALIYAKAFQAQLWLVHVTASSGDDLAKEASPQPVSQLSDQEMTAAQKTIRTHCDSIIKSGVDCDGQQITGSTTTSLLSEIEKASADMLIIGEKKHGSVYKALVGGSTSSKILKEISVPVLIVPITA